MPVSPHDENAGPENAGPKNAGPENAGPAARRSVASAWQRIAMAAAVVAALAGVGYLLATNSSGPAAVWRQAYDPTGHWWLSTVFAALPVLVLLAAIAILQLKAHVSACLGLVAALTVAIAVFHMPARLAMTAAVYGAGYGLFPICWIVLPVIFLYRLTIKAGQFEALQRSLANITEDSRLQLVLIAFALGAFFEGAAGFGTPVAVCGAILISLGFRPLQAAGLALLANTAPVAFGSLGIPIIALHGVTGIDIALLSSMTARLLVPFCILVPFWMIWAFAGLRATLEVWPAILVAGVTFAGMQWAMATFHGPWLVDIAASVVTILLFVAFLKVWKPARILNPLGKDITSNARKRHNHSRTTIFKAWLPWLTLSVTIFIWGTPQFAGRLDRATTVKLAVNGLHNQALRMPPAAMQPTPEPAVFNLNWGTATGTGIVVAAVLAGLMMGLSLKTIAATFLETAYQIRYTALTIAAMLGLGFITRYCGLDATLGLAFARTGSLYPFFGALVGWLGTASTGSDTSSNVLFGSLQKMTAQQIGVPPVLMASANSAGGVMAKMMAAQSIVVASTATQTYGQEGAILRFVFLHSIALACLAGGLVYLIAYVYPFTLLVPVL
jgi:lactate permease